MTLLGNRYRIENQLGEGGMGAVYRAFDRLTSQTVALKKVTLSSSPSGTGSSSASTTLRISLAREFQTLASLRHPHIIRVLDYGFDSERQPYFTMALLEKGKTIREVAAERDLEGKIDLLVQLLQALAYLHRRGILHRDLKPGNVLVEEGENVRVLDFGLAIPHEQKTAETAGTVAYMAPEVLSRGEFSNASDLYAVGIIAYEFFAGKHPFDTSSIQRLVRSILFDKPDLSHISTATARQIQAAVEAVEKAPTEIEDLPTDNTITTLEDGLDMDMEATVQQAPIMPLSLSEAEEKTFIKPYDLDATTPEWQNQTLPVFVDPDATIPDVQDMRDHMSALSPTEATVPESDWDIEIVIDQDASVTVTNFDISTQEIPLPLQALARSRKTLEAIVGQLLAHNPAERYQDAYNVIHDLSTLIGRPVYEESAAIRESFLQAATFVGRDAELGHLTAVLNQAMMGNGTTWLVGGESGVGKSRLLDELRVQALVRGAQVIRGQSVMEGGLPYQLWREPLRRLVLSVEISDSEAAILKEIIADIDVLLEREIPDAPSLEGKAKQQRFILTIADLLRRQSQPTVLLLEDLHWAGMSMTVLQHMTVIVKQLPLLIVASYRLDERPDLHQELPEAEHLKLERLSNESVAALSISMLGEAGSQAQLLDFLIRETEGNVFFMVETVRALAEEAGQLNRVANMQLPAQVFAGGVWQIVQRRLAHVPEEYLPLLKLAAIIGRQLNLELVGFLEPASDLDMWVSICANVAVFDQQDGKWRFAHDKLREALLNDLPDDELRVLNRRVAEAIETLHPNDRAQARILMEHWHQAGNVEKETSYARIAGEYALSISNFNGALQLFARALELLPDDDTATCALIYMKIAKAEENLSNYVTARQYHENGLELARKENNPSLIIEGLNGLGWVAELQGSYDEARALSEESLALSTQIHDAAGMATALKNLGNISRLRGDYENARANYEKSLEIRTRLNDQQGMAVCLNNLGLTAYFTGNQEEARQNLEAAVEIHQRIGARFEYAAGLGNLGAISGSWGDMESAQQYFEDSLAVRRDIGDRTGVASMLNNLGVIAKEASRYEEAIRYYTEGLNIRREIGDRSGYTNSLNNLGEAAAAQGEFDAAINYFREAIREGIDMAALPLVLQTVVEFAGLRARMEEYDSAAQWLALASAHPASDREVQRRIEPIMAALREKLTEDELENMLNQGRALELDAVITSILASQP